MKKILSLSVFLSVFLLLLMPDFSAVEISLSKSDYFPGELFQAEITGSFSQLSKSNIFIYSQGIPRPEPVVSDILKKDKYYYYAILPQKVGNYTFKIQNAEYLQEGKTLNGDIEKNFTISYASGPRIKIDQGFIVSSGDFEIKITAVSDVEINANLKLTNQSYKISLSEGRDKTLNFKSPNSTTSLNINEYTIPVFFTESVSTKNYDLSLNPNNLTGTLLAGQTYNFSFLIENTGTKALENVNILSDMNITISPQTLSLAVLESKRIGLRVFVPESGVHQIMGNINIEHNLVKKNLPASFKVTKEEDKVNISGTNPNIQLKKCSEMNGVQCLDNNVCDITEVESTDGNCCLGKCIGQKGSSTWIFGVLLLLVVAGIIAFVIWKKKHQKIPSATDLLKKKTMEFKNRMNVQESKEINGGLSKI